MNNYIQIGYTKKTHGVNGELKIVVEEEFIEDFDAVEVLFLKIKGQFTPYFIESVRSPKNPIIKFEEVNTKEAAFEMMHTEVFLRSSEVSEKEETIITIQIYEGFTIIDKNLGQIGTIESVIEFPQQDMAFVTYKGNEVMIPLNDAIVTQINEDKKELIVELPEGLLEL